MALKIRLRKQGRRNRPFYRLVVTDARCPRDGRYLESLGWYNPVETQDERVLSLNGPRIQHWLNVGAEITDNALSLVKRAAPDVSKWLVERQLQHKARVCAKRKKSKEPAKK